MTDYLISCSMHSAYFSTTMLKTKLLTDYIIINGDYIIVNVTCLTFFCMKANSCLEASHSSLQVCTRCIFGLVPSYQVFHSHSPIQKITLLYSIT